jgi:Kdo2-lipid IVA lauroyltransferase/acyltransferase
MIKQALLGLLSNLFGNYQFKWNGLLHHSITFLLEKILRYRKKVIIKNLSTSFPSKSRVELGLIQHDVYKYIALYLLQSISAFCGKKTCIEGALNVTISDDLLKDLEKNEDIIFLSGHYGNWELISVLLPIYFKREVVAVYKPLSDKVLDIFVKKARARFGLELVPMEETVNYLKQKKGSIYILVSDQSPASASGGEWFDFLNQKTLFYRGADVFSKKFDAIVYYQKINIENDKYHLSFVKLDVAKPVSQYVNLLEKDILNNPAPWLWSHNRWKHKYTQ